MMSSSTAFFPWMMVAPMTSLRMIPIWAIAATKGYLFAETMKIVWHQLAIGSPGSSVIKRSVINTLEN